MGLALASALVVLLASGVAISRMGDNDDEGPSVSASGPTASTFGIESGPSGSGPSTGSGSGGSGAGSGGSNGADQAAGAADALATNPGTESPAGAKAKPAPQRRAAAATGGGSRSDAETGSAAAAGSSGSAGSGEPAATGSPDGGTAGGSQGGGGQGGQEAKPKPSQDRPEQKPLLAASASVGQGAQGGVVGLAVDGGSPELDVTVGTDQVVGNHPPSQGTGVNFGGRFFDPPPTVPVLPG